VDCVAKIRKECNFPHKKH